MPDPMSSEATAPIVFYDGDCGLCHGAVRFVLARDTEGIFRFAALDSPAFERLVSAKERTAIPDSMVVRTPEGRTLTQSDAVVEMLRRLGGGWAVFGTLLRAVPRFVRNPCYAFVAAVRARMFARPEGSCPVMAPDLQARFLFD